jgi:hypothetical protein
MARTAVIAGTATAVSKGVSGSMDQRAAQQQAAQQAAQQQQQQAAFDAGFQQAQAQQQQQAAQQAGAPQAAGPATNTDTMISQLQQLAELQNLGILTPDEFTQQKARILGGAS